MMFTKPKSGALRVALVGCAASKLNRPAEARVFYTSNLFRLSCTYAEATCDALLIVSAFYGVVAPKAVLYPYERHLRAYGKRDREAWGVRAISSVLPAFKAPPKLVLLAGAVYTDALTYGAHWHNLPRPEEPLRRIVGCGPRMAWLKENTPRDVQKR